jgi:hypothetical protein
MINREAASEWMQLPFFRVQIKDMATDSGNGCFSNAEAISLRIFEPSVRVFPVKANGFLISSEKYTDNSSGGVSALTSLGAP